MPLMICPKCKRFHYVPGDCPAPREESVPAMPKVATVVTSKKGRTAIVHGDKTLTEKGRQVLGEVIDAAADAMLAKSKGGRPKIHPDRKVYRAKKAKEYRERDKAK